MKSLKANDCMREKKISLFKNHAVALIYNSTSLRSKNSCASYPRSFERMDSVAMVISGENKEKES